MNKIIGIVSLVAGIALLLWGYDVYDSASAQVTRFVNGDTPKEAWVGFIGGGICVLFGLLKLK